MTYTSIFKKYIKSSHHKIDKPNILFIVVDQLTAQALQFYNNNAVTRTPNLDRLMQSGVVFENAYCPSPLCTPSRYGIMTGQYVKHHKGYDNSALMDSLKPTMAHYARLSGYQTILAGKMHFVGSDQLHGFEQRLNTDVYPVDFGWLPDWTKPYERIDLWYHNMSSVKQSGVAAITNQLDYDDEVMARTRHAIYQLARREPEEQRPFLLTVGFIHPHDPYVARHQYWDLYNDIEIPLPKTRRPNKQDNDSHCLRLEQAIDLDRVIITDEDILRSRRAYFANVSMLDDWLGDILSCLKSTNQLENTIVVFSSDHGDFLGERGLWYKMSFYDMASHVPLIFYAPNYFTPKKITQPVSLIDLLPTFAELVSYQGDWIEPIDGKSLMQLLLKGQDENYPETIATEYCAEAAIEPMLMLRNQEFKFTYAPSDMDLLFRYHDGLREIPCDLNHYQDEVAYFRRLAAQHWDELGGVQKVKSDVIDSQRRRRMIHAALRIGNYFPWDFEPKREASQEFIRSHLDLTSFDVRSRYPRPPKYP